MQCSNCQFENMPGVQACGRCGASLQLASLAIDVHPPRAGRAIKWWRRWFPTTRYWNRLWTAAAGALGAIRMPGWPSEIPTPAVLSRMIFPGWAQRYVGRAARGKWMSWGYLGLLLAGLLFAGTPLGWMLLGLAVSLHAASILDLVAARLLDFRQRLIYSGVTLVLLIAAVYYPASWLLAQVATPQRFAMTAPPFEAGDVVLANPAVYRWWEPQPGDVVLYNPTPQTVFARTPDGRAANYRLGGSRVDRVIARAGQRVTCSQGKLLVDGAPSPWLPLNPQGVPDGLDVTVPENCYAIFPSGDPFSYPLPVWQTISIVPRGQISGRVYLRYQPLWRFGPIR